MSISHNFIVVCHNNEIYDFAYNQLNQNDFSFFDNHFPYKRLSKFLYSVSFSRKICNLLKHTGKRYWMGQRIDKYKNILEGFHQTSQPLCFILLADCLPLEKYGLTDLLRKEFPNCSIIYFFQDLISRDLYKQDFIKNRRESVDGIVTFDSSDAKKYNLFFHNIPYSANTINNISNNEYDICFVGQAKNRLNEIIDAYVYFKKRNLRCEFYIVGVPKKEQILSDEIHYCQPMSYKEYLSIIAKSKCILEIMQKGGAGNTIRVNEAIALNKYLITNNRSIINNSLYYPKFMYTLDSIENVNIEELFKHQQVVFPDYLIQSMSPNAFLEYIEKSILMKG